MLCVTHHQPFNALHCQRNNTLELHQSAICIIVLTSKCSRIKGKAETSRSMYHIQAAAVLLCGKAFRLHDMPEFKHCLHRDTTSSVMIMLPGQDTICYATALPYAAAAAAMREGLDQGQTGPEGELPPRRPDPSREGAAHSYADSALWGGSL